MESQKSVEKNCSKCNKPFECLHTAECWCMEYEISPENLKLLKESFDNCLCPQCLNFYSSGKKSRKQ